MLCDSCLDKTKEMMDMDESGSATNGAEKPCHNAGNEWLSAFATVVAIIVFLVGYSSMRGLSSGCGTCRWENMFLLSRVNPLLSLVNLGIWAISHFAGKPSEARVCRMVALITVGFTYGLLGTIWYLDHFVTM